MSVAEISFNLKDPQEREKVFGHLYEEVFPVVTALVHKQGGSLQDAKDIFQDALVIFYEKSVSGTLSIHLSDEAYLVGIVKHLWIRKFKADLKFISLDHFEKEITLPEDVNHSSNNRLLHLLEVTGKKCLELLKSIYYDKQSMDEVSKTFGFSGAHSVSAQKYKCIEKIKDTVKQKSLQYGDFTE
ncbi:MAG TPA: sigma-70 family RNA polymerase sigma factor [Cyclobacteriaceae bacterium]